MAAVRRRPTTLDPEIWFGPQFAEDVKRARQAKGWTQIQLARRVGAENNTVISNIERYSTKKSKLVRPLCHVLGLKLPIPEQDNPVLQQLLAGCQALASSPDDLQLVLLVVKRLLTNHYTRP